MNFRPLVLQTSLLTLGMACGGAHAANNLLSDGDFENFAGQVTDGGYTVVDNGTLDAWTVGATSVDLIRNNDGSISDISVDMSGTPGPGSLSRNFSATQGATHLMSWDSFRNGNSTDRTVPFGGQSHVYISAAAVTGKSLRWTALSAGTQTVSFAGGNGSSGPTLDKVMLTVVEEPQTYALLLGGLGAVGFMAKRRKF